MGVLPLAMVEGGGQMGASGAGVPLCISGDGVLNCFGLSVLSVRQWGILTGLAFRLSGTD